MSLFSPRTGIVGGSLIGASTGVLLLFNGDIMGISGIMHQTLVSPVKSLRDPKSSWRWVWLSAFCTSAHLYVNYLAPPSFLDDSRSKAGDVHRPSTAAITLGGFLVGFGTRLGNGCTTGHGICGMARMSKRSFVATCTFCGVGMITRYVISPLRSWASVSAFLRAPDIPSSSPLTSALVMVASSCAAIVSPSLIATSCNTADEKTKKTTIMEEWIVNARKTFGASLSGAIFAAGLAVSGMTKNSKVHDFLCLSGLQRSTFDPTLVSVLCSAIATSWISYQFVDGWSTLFKSAKKDETNSKTLGNPVCTGKDGCFSVPTNTVVDAQLVSGEAIFGLGWGLTGLCPGPAVFAAASGIVNVACGWLPAFVIGSYAAQRVKEALDSQKQKQA